MTFYLLLGIIMFLAVHVAVALSDILPIAGYNNVSGCPHNSRFK